jgi:hypothetical protein
MPVTAEISYGSQDANELQTCSRILISSHLDRHDKHVAHAVDLLADDIAENPT